MPDETSSGGPRDPPADESTLTASPGQAQVQLTARPGDRFGRYKILEEIGQGGCGAVFIAEQEEPVRRRVALKVIKLGMDTRQVIARFEAERQALAITDHPNIARVLDAGATDTGRPFFVMELVRGIKITDYCDQSKLSTTDRLKLFTQVCQAVQHAHQKGIIHRDLKPSNILVTLQDGVAVPKVIDFGIAKATANQRLTDKTVYTALEQFMGTPAYMSPEQAEITGLDVDTRSDIYSLGVLLYELLVGETPFSPEELLGVGLDAMRRVLREKDPARPSTRLSTMTQADLTAIAQHRQSEAPKLIRLVRGDLDWIVLKCLEKDRSRRYDTANGLAMDIQRHLNNELVVARPQSRLYRFQKIVRRNRAAFAAAAAFVALLIVGILVSTSQAVRATRAEREQSRLRQDAVASRNNEAQLRSEAQANEQKAKTEAVKSKQVARFLEDMLKGTGPSVALGRDTTLLREILGKTAERVGNDLTNEPEVEAELLSTIGTVYFSLSDYPKAEAVHRQALGLQTTAFGTSNPVVAATMHELAKDFWKERKLGEAEQMHRDALALRKSILGAQNPDVAASLNNLGRVLQFEGKFDEAAARFREALLIQRAAFGNESVEVAEALKNLSDLLNHQDKRDEAERDIRESVAIQRRRGESLLLAQSLGVLGQILTDSGNLDEAERAFHESRALLKKLNVPRDSAYASRRLADVLIAKGNRREAEQLYVEVERFWVEPAKHGDGEAMSDLAGAFESLMSLAEQFKARGQTNEADLANEPCIVSPALETSLREVISRKMELLSKHDNTINGAFILLALILEVKGEFHEAEIALREKLEAEKEIYGSANSSVADSMIGLARFLAKQEKYSEAETILREAIAMRRKLLGNEHAQKGYAFDWLGYCLVSQGKLSSAKVVYCEAAERGNALSQNAAAWLMATGPPDVRDGRRAVEFSEKAVAKTTRSNASYLNTLAAALAEAGQFARASAVQKEALAALRDESDRAGYQYRLRLYESAAPYRDHDTLAKWADGLLRQAKFAEAEPVAREYLALREKEIPDDWRTFNARSMLGAALLGQKQFAEGEPLLLSGYEGMNQRRANIPANAAIRPRQALQRLVELYEQTARPEQAAEYRKELAELGKTEK